MASVTVAEIIARAQQAADMEDDFISQTTWLYWANIEYKKLYTRLARSGYPVSYTDESITITGAAQYNKPEQFAIVGMRGVTTSGRYFHVPIVHPMNAVGLSGTYGIPTQCTITHDPLNVGNEVVIRFWPIPTSGTYLMGLIVKPKNLIIGTPAGDNTNVVTLPNGWEERIVLGMARRALGKEETINPAVEAEIRDMDLTIEDNVRSYLLRDQPTVHDMNSPSLGQLPPYGDWYFL